jgi:hypothetical protein
MGSAFRPTFVAPFASMCGERLTQWNRDGFPSKPAYVGANSARLIGTAYDRGDAVVKFEATNIGDRGRGSAESRSGADLALTADVSDRRVALRKAVLVQAKLGSIGELHRGEMVDLYRQRALMKLMTRAPKVMQIVARGNVRRVEVISANRLFERARAINP